MLIRNPLRLLILVFAALLLPAHSWSQTIRVRGAVTSSSLQEGSAQWCRSTTGNDTYACNLTPALLAYTRGGCLVLDADTANTGAATINVQSLGAKSVLNRAGGALSDGDITADKPITVCYDGTQFVIQGDGGGGGGGSGTVTSVDATGGVQTASGSPITSTGTVRGATVANAQTGTSYTVLTGDRGKTITFSNGSAIAVTLPQAGSGFEDGWYTWAKNLGAGTVTITPTTSTISGAATITLETGDVAYIRSDGTNYEAYAGKLVVGTGILVTKSRTGQTIAIDTATVPTKASLQSGAAQAAVFGLIQAARLLKKRRKPRVH